MKKKDILEACKEFGYTICDGMDDGLRKFDPAPVVFQNGYECTSPDVSVCFVSQKDARFCGNNSMVFCTDKTFLASKKSGNIFIICSNPRLAFAQVMNRVADIPEPDVVIHKSSVPMICQTAKIGGIGFGYERDRAGVPIQFPHFAGVRIGENVAIGSYSCVDRGALSHTIIQDNAKIDNLVHIAHGANIGHDSIICAGAIVCGSVTIGPNCFIGAGAMIKNGVTVGKNAIIGMGAVVVKDVSDGATVKGNPAK